jgi:hypothetical protein
MDVYDLAEQPESTGSGSQRHAPTTRRRVEQNRKQSNVSERNRTRDQRGLPPLCGATRNERTTERTIHASPKRSKVTMHRRRKPLPCGPMQADSQERRKA